MRHFNLRFSLDCSIILQNKTCAECQSCSGQWLYLPELVLTQPVTDNNTVSWNVRIDHWYLTTISFSTVYVLAAVLCWCGDGSLDVSEHQRGSSADLQQTSYDPDNTSSDSLHSRADRRPSMTSSMFTSPQTPISPHTSLSAADGPRVTSLSSRTEERSYTSC